MKLFTKRNLIAAGAVAVAFFVIAASFYMNGGIAVESAAVERGEITKLLKESGTVESYSSIAVVARNSGEVKGVMVEEGDSIEAGDLLMASGGTSTVLDIKSRRAELSGLQAQYSQARELADKNKELYEQGALSYYDYNTSNTAAKQLAAQIASLKFSTESYAEATGAEGVMAPVGGVLTGVYVKEGESVSVGAPLFEISNLEAVYIKADFIAEDADLIEEGNPVRIFNEDAGFNDKNGTVKKVFLKAEEKMSDLGVSQRRVTVEILFGAENGLRLGSNVDVEIAVEKKENVLRVPDMAVFEKNRTNCSYVIEGGKAVLRRLETGLEGEDHIEVVSGLLEGDRVILSPKEDIKDGTRVKEQD